MASVPRPTPWKIAAAASSPIVWASDTVALKKYFPAAVAVAATIPAPTTANRRAFQRRQYPGDTTPVSQAASQVAIFREPSLSNGPTPGRVFWCEETVTGPLGKPVKKRKQFTYQGPFSAVKTVARAAPALNFVIRNASGAAYPVTDTTP